ncbi:uncharacterized protein C2orf72 homolog [Hyperolius riggenbachi]|uniref:uncharacterized protein C2orf72 homolog n=1 Tax=Hyperolius riggenbachi TaxID=752182 RepID=UPI0035A2E199
MESSGWSTVCSVSGLGAQQPAGWTCNSGMARDCTESRFREVLSRYGGVQQVQLVGELWDRLESRALLDGFLRELFPAELPDEADTLRCKAAEQRAEGDPGPEQDACDSRGISPEKPQPKQDRTLRFGLIFFLCRPESLSLPGAKRQLREILRDVRERMAAGGAVVGVIVRPDSTARRSGSVNGQQEMGEDGHGDSRAELSALLSMLQSVFRLKSRGKIGSEVRAAVLIPGQPETRRDIQRLACEALTAADELRKQRPEIKPRCFSWRRRRWEDSIQKEHLEEGTALAVLQYPNGDCSKTTDA